MPRRRRNILHRQGSLGLVLLIIAGIFIVLVGSSNQIMVIGVKFDASAASIDFDEVNSNSEYRIINIIVPAYNPYPIDGMISDMNFTLYNVQSGDIVGQGRILGPLKIPAGKRTNLTLRLALRNSTEIVTVLKETIKTGILSLSLTGKYRLSVLGFPIIPLPFTTALPIPIRELVTSLFSPDTVTQLGGNSVEELSTIPLPMFEGVEGDKARFRFQIPFQVPDMDFGEIVLRNAILYINSSRGMVGSTEIDYLKLLPGTRSVLDVEVDVNIGPEANGTVALIRDILDKRKLDIRLKFIGDLEVFGLVLPNIEFPAPGESFNFVYNLPDSATLSGILENYLSEDVIMSGLNTTINATGNTSTWIKNPSFKYISSDDEWIYAKLEFTVKVPESMVITTWDIPITVHNLTGYLLFDRSKHAISFSTVMPTVQSELIVGRVRMYHTDFSLNKEIAVSLFFDLHKVEATRLFLIQFIKYQTLFADIEGFANITILGMNIGEIHVKVPLKLTNKTIVPILHMLLPTILSSRYYPPFGSGNESEPPLIVLNDLYSGEYNEAYHDVYVKLAVRNIQMIPIYIRFFEFEYYYNGTKIGEGRILESPNFTTDSLHYTNFTLYFRIYNQSDAVNDLLKIMLFNWTILGTIKATLDVEIAGFRLGIIDGVEFDLFFVPSQGVSAGGTSSVSFTDFFQLAGASFKQLIKSVETPEFGPGDSAPSPLPCDWDGDPWTGNETGFKRAVLQLALNLTTKVDFVRVNSLYIAVYPDPNDALYADCLYLDKPAIEAKVIDSFSLDNASTTPVEAKFRAVIYRHVEYPQRDPTYLMLKKAVMEMTTPAIVVSGYADLMLFGIPISFRIPEFAVSEIFLAPLLGGEEASGSIVNSSVLDTLSSMYEYNVTDIVLVDDTGLPHTLSRDGSSVRANPFAAFPDPYHKQWAVFDLMLGLRQDFIHVFLDELSIPIYSPRAKYDANASPVASRYVVGFNNKSYVGEVLLPGTTRIPPLYGEQPILLDEMRFYLDYVGCSVYGFRPGPYELKPGVSTDVGFRIAIRRVPAPYAYVPLTPGDPNSVFMTYVTDPQYYRDNPSPAWDFTAYMIYGMEYFYDTPSMRNYMYDQMMSVWCWADEAINAYAKIALFWPDWQFDIFIGNYLSSGFPLAANLSEELSDISNGIHYDITKIHVLHWEIVGPIWNPGFRLAATIPVDYDLPAMAPVWMASISMGFYYGGTGEGPDYNTTRKWATVSWPSSHDSPIFSDPLGSGRYVSPLGFTGTPSKKFHIEPYIELELHLSDIGQIIWDIISKHGFWVVVKDIKPITCIYGYMAHYPEQTPQAQWVP